MAHSFVHLHVHTPYSLMDGGSSVEDIVSRACDLGMNALAITDHNNVSAAILFSKLAKQAGIKPIQGAEIELSSGGHLTLISKGPAGYSNLCKILTHAHLSSSRLSPSVSLDVVSRYKDGLYILSGCRNGEIPSLILRGTKAEVISSAQRYRELFGSDFFIEMQTNRLPLCNWLNQHLVDLADHMGIRVVATGNVHNASKDAFRVHDTLTCMRTHSTLDEVASQRRLNAEDYLFDQGEAELRFGGLSKSIMSTRDIADSCEPALNLEIPFFPHFEDVPSGQTTLGYLRELVYKGAETRYTKLTATVRNRLEHELDVIAKLSFEDYFLFVWDVARYAKENSIRFAGRGSAADSAVAYCLFITNVDSVGRGLLFERFMSLERAQRPDIDIDFDARLRDKVLLYVYEKYGADKVAMVCTFNRYYARSAIREVGKAFGIPRIELDTLAKKFPYVKSSNIRAAIAQLPELRDSNIPVAKYEQFFDICERISGFPRHIGTHLGGIVVCREPLTQLTPLQRAAKGVMITQFDKDYIEDLGLVKLDLLCLRTLSAVEDSIHAISLREASFDYDRIPLTDPKTYDTLNSGQTIGVFQLESPAQRVLQSRLGASNIEDIVASVALIRPGPIEGNMVEPYIARRQCKEPVSYLHSALRPILEKTYGVVLFQEQVIEIATVIAGFTPGEADRLRRVMTHCRSRGDMDGIGRDFIEKAVLNGISQEVATTIFSYIMGYAGYGFCEAHAAAFSDTAFKTAYLVTHYPAEFYAAILNNEPMGYYPAHTVCVEARRRGVGILGPDINTSTEFCLVEGGKIRLSLKLVKGVSEPFTRAIIDTRTSSGRISSIFDLCSRVSTVTSSALEAMILSGCLDSLHPNRRYCLWLSSRAIRMQEMGGLLDDSAQTSNSIDAGIDDFSPFERMTMEYRYLGLSPSQHMMSYYRKALDAQGVLRSSSIPTVPTGKWVRVGGVLIRPHRPPTKSGRTVVFFSLEDEEGLFDVTVFESVYQLYGKLIFTQSALIVEGRLERRGNSASIIASRIREFPLHDALTPEPEAISH